MTGIPGPRTVTARFVTAKHRSDDGAWTHIFEIRQSAEQIRPGDSNSGAIPRPARKRRPNTVPQTLIASELPIASGNGPSVKRIPKSSERESFSGGRVAKPG